jgi:hypothetical protein
MTLEQMLAELPRQCSLGVKKTANDNGNIGVASCFIGM